MIFIIEIILIALCVTGAYTSVYLDNICSSKIISLNNPNRDINFKDKPFLCDTGLSKGLYTFGTNNSIPNTCVSIGSCASDAPFWTPDRQPNALSPDPVVLKICTSISTTGNDVKCHFDCNLKINAAYCKNIDAIVYELIPVKICNQRWCYTKNDLKPCNDNESSPTGYQPCTSTFPFNSLKNTITTFGISETESFLNEIPGVSLVCKIKCPPNLNCSEIDGDVFWYTTQSSKVIKETILNYDEDKNELYSYLIDIDWAPNTNNYFYCSITPKLDGNRPFKSIVTPNYYAGLVFNIKDPNGYVSVIHPNNVSAIKLSLYETDTRFSQVDIHSTIPILCNSNAESCGIEVQLVTEASVSGRDKIRIVDCSPTENCKGCTRTLKSQILPNNKNVASFKLIGTIDDKNNQLQEIIKVNFKMKYYEILKPETKIVKRQFPPPPIPNGVFPPGGAGNQVFGAAAANGGFGAAGNVAFVPVNLGIAQAQFFNDPHILTHDGTEIEFHGRDGEYLLLENKDAQLRIHTISRLCSNIYSGSYLSHVYCNFALYIQSFDDFVYYELPNPQRLYYKDLSNLNSPLVMLAFDPRTGHATIPKTSSVKISMDNEYYKIVTHFATTIKIHRTNNNYYVNPSKFDYGRIFGLLGNFNNNPNDDITNTRCGRVTTEKAYLDCYRVTSPLMSQRQFYQIPPLSNITQYCMCASNTPICTFGLRQDDVRTNLVGKRSISTEDKKYNITFDTLDIITKKAQVFDTYNKKNNPLFFKQLRVAQTSSYCIKALNTTVFHECHKQKLINLTQLIKLCELDFEISKLDWTATYYDLALDDCKTKLLYDRNNYVNSSNGVQVPQLDVLADLCPYNCYGKGSCIGGKCYCDPQFDGFDCSIDTLTPLKILKSSSINDICNGKSTSTCLDVLLSVNRVTPDLTIDYQIFYKSSNGSFELLDYENSDIYMISENLLYIHILNKTKIPDGSLSVYFVNITIKEIELTSEPLVYAIINDDCHQCNDNSLECNVKLNKCDINSICYNSNDKNPLNSTEICDPSTSRLGWSTIKSVSNWSEWSEWSEVSNWSKWSNWSKSGTINIIPKFTLILLIILITAYLNIY